MSIFCNQFSSKNARIVVRARVSTRASYAPLRPLVVTASALSFRDPRGGERRDAAQVLHHREGAAREEHHQQAVAQVQHHRRVDFLWLYFGSNSDEKSSIFASFLMLLPSACRFFRGSISASISTKNHRFWRAFRCNYLRRVNFFVPRTRELLFGPACQRGLRTRRYGR